MFGISRTPTVLDAIMLGSSALAGRTTMAHRDDPSDPSRRLEAVDTPGLGERVQARLAEELRWYDARARENQLWYRAIKVVQLVAAALVPVMAGVGVSAWITGGLGSVVVVLEGVQQLYQFQEHWIVYRTTWEGLRREQHLYEARGGDYATAASAPTLLAERIEALVAREHARWVSVQEAAARGAMQPRDG
jgi:hypothetical protein